MSPTGRKAFRELRSAKIWSSGLNEDTNMKTSGKAKKIARMIRTRYRTAVRAAVDWFVPAVWAGAAGAGRSAVVVMVSPSRG
jgi:hypothetical protein